MSERKEEEEWGTLQKKKNLRKKAESQRHNLLKQGKYGHEKNHSENYLGPALGKGGL